MQANVLAGSALPIIDTCQFMSELELELGPSRRCAVARQRAAVRRTTSGRARAPPDTAGRPDRAQRSTALVLAPPIAVAAAALAAHTLQSYGLHSTSLFI